MHLIKKKLLEDDLQRRFSRDDFEHFSRKQIEFRQQFGSLIYFHY